MDQFLDSNRQQFDAYDTIYFIICGGNRLMETKHSLVDTQNYRMLQTNGKRWVNLKFLSQKHDVAHFSARPYFGHQNNRSDLLICEAKKCPQTHDIDFLGISNASHVFFRRLFRNELCTKNAESPEMLKTDKGSEFEAS